MKYFGTDGIRGKVNKNIIADTAFRIGKAMLIFGKSEMILGYDTRESNHMFAFALASGAMSVGINVKWVGVTTTPSIIYYSYLYQIPGVIVTASHNPYDDNGIKIVHNGYKLKLEEIERIENIIENDYKIYDTYGVTISAENFRTVYLQFLRNHITENSLRIAFDCSNGATCEFVKELFPSATLIACKPNGKNINDHVGSTHIEHLRKYILANDLDLGFAFDGDGDRVIMVDSFGKVYNGDAIIYIIARYLQEINQLNNNTIAITSMSNLGFLNALSKNNISYMITDVGDKHIHKAIVEENLSLGGETSGHIIIPSLFHSGDGILIALFILKILAYYNSSPSDLVDFNFYPEIEFKLPLDKIKRTKVEITEKLKEIKINFQGKIIVRKSGTEPVLRGLLSSQNKDEMMNTYKELLQFLEGL